LLQKNGEFSCQEENSMPEQKRFTREFEEEAVRLVRTSGRTQREVAHDLGIGLSTLVRWIARGRDRLIEAPAAPAGGESVADELKRLRRENEILRQAREILKRAATFFAKEGSR
jgi:transposase